MCFRFKMLLKKKTKKKKKKKLWKPKKNLDLQGTVI